MEEVQQHLWHIFVLIDDLLDVILQLLPPLLQRFGPQMGVPFAREIRSLDDLPELSVESLKLTASSEHIMLPLIKQDFNSEKLSGLSRLIHLPLHGWDRHLDHEEIFLQHHRTAASVSLLLSTAD